MATGDITQREILDAADVFDGVEGCCIRLRVEGWSAATGVTLVPGFTAADPVPPSAPKLALTVTSPGYDEADTLGSASRSMWGTCLLHKLHPNHADVHTSTSGSDLDVFVMLDEEVCTGDTAVAVIGAGLLTSSVGSSNAVSGSVTNSSALVHEVPNLHWAVEQRRAANGVVKVKAIATSRYARNQKMLACMRITATGAGGGSFDSGPITQMTLGDDGIPTYEADFNMSTTNGFVRGAVVTINAIGSPWVGATRATSAGTSSTVNFGELLWTVMDEVICVVDPVSGNDGTAAASPSVGTADASPAQTTQGAVAAIRAYNNTTHSLNRADGGVVQLKAGSYLHGLGLTGNSAHTVNGYVTFTRHSTATRAQVKFTGPNTDSRYQWQWERLYDLTVELSASSMLFAASTAVLVMENITFVGNFNISGGDGVCEFINCTITASTCVPINSDVKVRLNYGSVGDGLSSGGNFFPRNRVLIGYRLTNCTGGVWSSTAGDGGGKPIFWYCSAKNNTGGLFFPLSNVEAGFVVVLHEYVGSSNALIEVGSVDCTLSFFHTTFAGDRENIQGGWVADVNNRLRVYNVAYSWKWFAWKGNHYNTGHPTLTKSLQMEYGVGWKAGHSEHDWAVTAGDEFPPTFAGMNSTRNADPGYTDDQSRYGGGAGNGDYIPASGSTLLARVATLLQAVRWDLDGTVLGASAAAGAFQPLAPVGDPAPRYMWWACGAQSYEVAGLPAELRNNGWESFADNVLIPRFEAFNDDDEAKCIIHAPFGRSRTETGDIQFDALLMRREEGEFPLVYDLAAFKAAMDAFYDACGQYPALYYGTIHGTEYDKWHRLSPQAFRRRALDSLAPLLCIPRAHRKIILDTAGVFGPAKGRQHPLMFGDRAWAQTEARRFPRTLQEPDTRGIAGVGSGVYYSGASTRIPSRFGGILAILKEIGIAGLGIEPRARLETGWEHGDETVDWWTTSQLMDSANDTESGTGAGWCLSSARCNGTFGVLVTDSRTEGEIATWLYGDPDNGVPAKAVAIGGLSDPGVTSSDMTGYVPA